MSHFSGWLAGEEKSHTLVSPVHSFHTALLEVDQTGKDFKATSSEKQKSLLNWPNLRTLIHPS